MDLRGRGWVGIDWMIYFRIGTTGGVLVNTIINLLGSKKCWEIFE
jgi:hypothetical protein